VTKTLNYGAFSIPYQVHECGFEKSCLAANAACHAKLTALMRAAVAAEIALGKAVDAKEAHKNNAAKAAAAKAAAAKEQAAAHAAMTAAKAVFDAATAQAASMKARYGEANRLSIQRQKELETDTKAYEEMKHNHLKAVAKYEGANSAAAKALKAYDAAVQKHCDAEAVHFAIIAQIGMPKQKSTCGKGDTNLQVTKAALPCTPKPCFPVCVTVEKKTCYGSFCIPYKANECGPDKKCEADNKKCSAILIAVLQAAQKAQKDLEAKAGLKKSAKATHAQKQAAAEAAKKEAAAAKKALDAAHGELQAAQKEAASAKSNAVIAKAASDKSDAEMEKQKKKYQDTKGAHLKAEAKYHGAKSDAAKASAAYQASIKAHCDIEALHASLVKQMNMAHKAQNNCSK